MDLVRARHSYSGQPIVTDVGCLRMLRSERRRYAVLTGIVRIPVTARFNDPPIARR